MHKHAAALEMRILRTHATYTRMYLHVCVCAPITPIEYQVGRQSQAAPQLWQNLNSLKTEAIYV